MAWPLGMLRRVCKRLRLRGGPIMHLLHLFRTDLASARQGMRRRLWTGCDYLRTDGCMPVLDVRVSTVPSCVLQTPHLPLCPPHLPLAPPR